MLENATKMSNNVSSTAAKAVATADNKKRKVDTTTAPSNKKSKTNFDTSVLNKQLDLLNISGRSRKHNSCLSTHKINGGRYSGYEGILAEKVKEGSGGALNLILVQNARGWKMLFPVHASISVSLVEKMIEDGTSEQEEDGKTNLGLGGNKSGKQNGNGNEKSDKIEANDPLVVGTGADKENLTVANGKAKTADSTVAKDKEESKDIPIAKAKNEGIDGSKSDTEEEPGIEGVDKMLEISQNVDGEGEDDALLMHAKGKWQCPRCGHDVSIENGFCPNQIKGRNCGAPPAAKGGPIGWGGCLAIIQKLAEVSYSFCPYSRDLHRLPVTHYNLACLPCLLAGEEYLEMHHVHL